MIGISFLLGGYPMLALDYPPKPFGLRQDKEGGWEVYVGRFTTAKTMRRSSVTAA